MSCRQALACTGASAAVSVHPLSQGSVCAQDEEPRGAAGAHGEAAAAAAAAAEAASAGAGDLLEPALRRMLHGGLDGRMAPGGAPGALAGAGLLPALWEPVCRSTAFHTSSGRAPNSPVWSGV